ncbi:hypothetical protein HK104_002488 [Borealophlyctis nickersoniae]|nr:hypothetical protein HK104_002488 [Borealophlyctis nickersoniae]
MAGLAPSRTYGSAMELNKSSGSAGAGFGVRPSSPGRLTLEHDTNAQLKAALELVQEAYDRRGSLLSAEIAQWKQVASNQRQQIQALESEVEKLNRRNTELERALSSQLAEKKALIVSKNALMDRYTALKKSATQLESFRKSIISMVEYTPNTNISELDRSFLEPSLGLNDITSNISSLSISGPNNAASVGGSSGPGLTTFMSEEAAKEGQHDLKDYGAGTNVSFVDDRTLRSFELNCMAAAEVTHASLKSGQSLDSCLTPTHDKPNTSRTGALQQQDYHRQQGLQSRTLNDTSPQQQTPLSQQRRRTDGAVKPRMGEKQLSFREENKVSPLSVDHHASTISTPNLSLDGDATARRNAVPTPSQASTAPLGHPTPVPTHVEAPLLYKQIRDVLPPQDFEEFAANVSAFNTSQQTAEETIRNIAKLVKDRTLFMNMRVLIYSALTESAKAGQE